MSTASKLVAAVAACSVLTAPCYAGMQAAVANSAAAPESSPKWVRGTPVRLMVITEINSRDVKAGQRYKLRVDAPLLVDDKVAIPVGATAWAEVVSSQGTEAAGGRGRVSIRLLYIDVPGGRVRISGTSGEEGKSNTSGVVLGVLSFGLLGLFTKGGNAAFKAGDIVTGYIDEGDAANGTPLVVKTN